jgi:hypothetical protein
MAFSDPAKGRQVQWSPGPSAPNITLAAACKEGDVLGYSSGWKPALATVSSVIQGRLVALKNGLSGEVIPVSHTAVVKGYSGATPGNPVYVAEGSSNGQVTETAPSTSGDANTIIGIVLAADTILFFLNSRADSTA